MHNSSPRQYKRSRASIKNVLRRVEEDSEAVQIVVAQNDDVNLNNNDMYEADICDHDMSASFVPDDVGCMVSEDDDIEYNIDMFATSSQDCDGNKS